MKLSLSVEWEPDTQALINASELEVRPEHVNTAVRQWLRQILCHRRYLERIKSDPVRHEKFKAQAKIYKRQYQKHGAQRDRPKKRKENGKVFAEDFAERVLRSQKKKPLELNRDDVIYLGPL